MQRSTLFVVLLGVLFLAHGAAVQATNPHTLAREVASATGASDVITQNEPPEQNGKINASVERSIQSETITLRAIFPADADRLKVSLHNLLGREMEVHPKTSATKGEERFTFDTRDLPNGPYFIVLEALGQRITKKIMVTR